MLKLFVFNEFSPNYSDGLAFAIAESVEEAKKMIADDQSEIVEEIRFGPVEERSIEKYCNWVNGSA